MKKFLSVVLITCLTLSATVLLHNKASAQFKAFTFDKTATASGADTATGNVNYPFTTATSITFSVTKVSGTLAGKVYVYASNLGNTYTLLDSATVTNTTGTKDYDFNGVSNATKFPEGSPPWYIYRFYYLQTGGAATIEGKALTRTGR